MGTGQLNAYRAWKQFAPGEWDPGTIPIQGWDYHETAGPHEANKYVFDLPLKAESYVSISLAWDRFVDLNDTNVNGLYDIGETFSSRGLSNLDLFLLPQGASDISQALWSSESTGYSVEHLFFQIPQTGQYEFWVCQATDSPFPSGRQTYAVAWQAVLDVVVFDRSQCA